MDNEWHAATCQCKQCMESYTLDIQNKPDVFSLLYEIRERLRKDDAQASCEQWGDIIEQISKIIGY